MKAVLACLALLLASCASAPAPALPITPTYTPAAELEAARAVFERNIEAIQAKDQAMYLSCYRQDDRLIRAGDEGVKLGFDELAASTSSVASTWPSRLEATQLTVHPVAPGVVYGAYHYAVTIKGMTTEGWSERVFVKDNDGWHIAVTTAFQTP